MTIDRNAELRRLNESDTHIADTETRITKQEIMVEQLRRDGHDTKEAERLLRTARESLGAMHQHRSAIVDVLAKIDAGLI